MVTVDLSNLTQEQVRDALIMGGGLPYPDIADEDLVHCAYEGDAEDGEEYLVQFKGNKRIWSVVVSICPRQFRLVAHCVG